MMDTRAPTREVEAVWSLGALLGEGPVWSPRDACLWFVDIKNRRIHAFDPATGAGRTLQAPDQVGFALPARGGGLVAGLPGALHHVDIATGTFTPLLTLEADRPGNRLNDGHVDADGRLWFGSMDDGESAASGALYSWLPGRDAAPVRHVDAIPITNGPCTSPDTRTFYHTDTLARTVTAFDRAADGTLSNPRTLITIEEGAGYPDGTVVDAEGCLWIGLYAGWAARRYSPQGELLSVLRFPCANITKLAFGGADGRDLYATTAAKGLSEAERAAQPLAGALFRARADVQGLPFAEVALPEVFR